MFLEYILYSLSIDMTKKIINRNQQVQKGKEHMMLIRHWFDMRTHCVDKFLSVLNFYKCFCLDQEILHKDKAVSFTVSFFSPFPMTDRILGIGLAPNKY